MLRSDNGLCYSSREFQQFLEFYQIHHITSSPHHPQSNGFTEALVGISKKLMEKSIKYGKLWKYGLLQYHVTPISSTIPSHLKPSQGGNPGLHFLRSLHQLGRLWKVPGSARNSSNDSQVLPPATAWISNQGSLYLSRKYMETSGKQEQLINLPENQIFIG